MSSTYTDTLEKKINEFLSEENISDVDIKLTYNAETKKVVALLQYRTN